MQDVIGDGIEQIAIMADDEDRRRIAGEIIDEPERAFEIEIIGRLVEKQKIGRGKEHGGERDAHAPAAGKFGKRALAARRGRSQGRREYAPRGRARHGRRYRRAASGFRRCDADRVAVSASLSKRGALGIGGEDEVEQARRAARRLLLDAAEPHLPRQRDRAGVRRQIAGDHIEQGGLAGAIAADEADSRPLGQGGRRLVEQQARPEPEGQLIQVKHARLWRVARAMASRIETGR